MNNNMPPPGLMKVGQVQVVTSSNGGHPPEFFAERIMSRVFVVMDSAPEPIKAQAHAYRDAMQAVILDGIKKAIASDRAYQTHLMLEKGK